VHEPNQLCRSVSDETPRTAAIIARDQFMLTASCFNLYPIGERFSKKLPLSRARIPYDASRCDPRQPRSPPASGKTSIPIDWYNMPISITTDLLCQFTSEYSAAYFHGEFVQLLCRSKGEMEITVNVLKQEETI